MLRVGRKCLVKQQKEAALKHRSKILVAVGNRTFVELPAMCLLESLAMVALCLQLSLENLSFCFLLEADFGRGMFSYRSLP